MQLHGSIFLADDESPSVARLGKEDTIHIQLGTTLGVFLSDEKAHRLCLDLLNTVPSIELRRAASSSVLGDEVTK